MNIMLLISSLIIFFAISTYLCITLAKESKTDNKIKGADIRLIYYFFSLALVLTSIIIYWGRKVGSISSEGNFLGTKGQFIEKIFHIMLDIPTDIEILFFILTIILLPQFISYFLSGLTGYASSPLLVNTSFNFVFWSIIKSLSTTSGILISVLIWGSFYHFDGWSFAFILNLTTLSISFLVLAIFFIFIYRNSKYLMKITLNKLPKKLKIIADNLQRWFTRQHL